MTIESKSAATDDEKMSIPDDVEEIGKTLHDFNNVLTGIFGSTSIIKNSLEKKGEISNEKLIRCVDRIDAASARAVEMIAHLREIKNKL